MGFWNDGISSYTGHSGHSGHSGSSSRRRGSGSAYSRRPRDGYVSRVISQIRRMLRSLYSRARRNPVKTFFLVIMPLITGGVLTKILSQFGIRLPPGLFGGMSGMSGAGRGGQFHEFERFSASSGGRGGGLGSLMGGGTGAGGVGALLGLAKMFM